MDTRDGRIYDWEELKKIFPEGELPEPYKEMKVPPTEKQLVRKPPKVGRNEPCPCGSGEKFKKCCLTGIQERGRRKQQKQHCKISEQVVI